MTTTKGRRHRSPPDDPYVIPGTDVLRNNFDIRDQRELHVLERVITYDALQELKAKPITGRFDPIHLSDIHHRLFHRVYPWAGEFRKCEIEKDGTKFLPSELVIPWMARTLNEAADKRHFRDMPCDRFVEHFTQLYKDLNAFHPFPEGNGRTMREFLRTMALKAGYRVDWSRLDAGELLHATVMSVSDRTDRGLHTQLERALVNKKPDRLIQREYDQLALGRGR